MIIMETIKMMSSGFTHTLGFIIARCSQMQQHSKTMYKFSYISQLVTGLLPPGIPPPPSIAPCFFAPKESKHNLYLIHD